ncbi:MAG: sigma 54-interacting transcriptional regulator [Opitutaceae bacterium]
MNNLRILILDSAPARQLAGPLRTVLQTSFHSATILEESIVPPDGTALWGTVSKLGADVVLFIAERHALSKLVASLQHPLRREMRVPLIAILDESAPDEVAALLRAGAADYVLPPLSAAHVVPRVMRVLAEQPLRPSRRPAGPVWTTHAMEQLVGRSPGFLAELKKIPVIASCETGVLIQGETGTGKELYVRAIHDLSTRAAKPFVPVNCGAIPAELAESELFGHERGAFTGAFAARKGLIAQAEGGTLFLDEVTSLPLLTQVKLLRFLQEREFRPLGATAVRQADVRVIAATNEPLEQAISGGKFRQDLFYRLNVIRVLLPPLRDRREDIPLLAGHFLTGCAKRFGRAAVALAEDAIEKLISYDWPGNVRELEHVIERTVVFCCGPLARSSDVALPEPAGAAAAGEFHSAKARTVAAFERSYIEGLLAAHRGNISSAARRAGKNRRAFWELIRKHHIEVGRFRGSMLDYDKATA